MLATSPGMPKKEKKMTAQVEASRWMGELLLLRDFQFSFLWQLDFACIPRKKHRTNIYVV